MDTPMGLVDNKLNIQNQCADILAHLNACTPSVRVACYIERIDNISKEALKPQEAAIISQQEIRHSAKPLEILV